MPYQGIGPQPFETSQTLSNSVDAGQELSLTTTADFVFAAAPAVMGVIVQALSTNTASVFVGMGTMTTAKGLELIPGAKQFFPVANANQLHCITATATQKVHALAF